MKLKNLGCILTAALIVAVLLATAYLTLTGPVIVGDSGSRMSCFMMNKVPDGKPVPIPCMPTPTAVSLPWLHFWGHPVSTATP